jgi:endogenous inhibitor of DNA gyrase (YacG/DUF329 family)
MSHLTGSFVLRTRTQEMSSTPEMDRRPPSEYPCPVCHRPSSRQNSAGVKNKFFPLCSERCKLIDLGAWLDAEYRIVSREEEEDLEISDL